MLLSDFVHFHSRSQALYANAAEHGKENAYFFNCYQRAHGNFLDSVNTVRFFTVFVGLFAPTYAAAFCAVYCLGRVKYGLDYSTSGPDARRLGGIISHVGDIPLFFMAVYHALKLAGFIGA